MNFYARGFNLILLLAVLLNGCASDSKKKKGFLGTLRIHIESRGNLPGEGGNLPNTGADLPDTVKQVKVLRADPVKVNIVPDSILSEQNMLSVRLVETPGGGDAIKIKFDEQGGWTLEQYAAADPGAHFVIFGQWDKNPEDGRWLAAPLINRRIADGTLTFTPDCSHEEAQKLVSSVNRSIEKIQTGSLK